MKLVYAIVDNDDSKAVSSVLTQNGFSVTKLASTGGFLMSGNTTFLICTDNDRVDELIELIRQHSRKRNRIAPQHNSYETRSYSNAPSEVSVGGATVFVTDIERFEKL